MIKITECPRDAMQGIDKFIPTEQKIDYLQSLLSVGFDKLDFGSFVSPKAIPQLKDTVEVLNRLDLSQTKTELLAIVAGKRGGEEAAQFDSIKYLGFPFSISPTFLKKNINSDYTKASHTVQELQNVCIKHNKELLVYISMAFGNPYGDAWSYDLLYQWVDNLDKMSVKRITLGDLSAEATPESIKAVFQYVIAKYPHIEFGLHLHSSSSQAILLISAAYKAGCRSFDTVLNDKGGCPMSGKELLQNLSTFELLSYLESNKIANKINTKLLMQSLDIANKIFP